jgi:hypothetical protein
VLAVTHDTLTKRADALTRFVRASAEGWKSYLANRRRAMRSSSAKIRRCPTGFSPTATQMREYAIVTGSDTATRAC